MAPGSRLISVVIPAFNEEECVDELCRRLVQVATKLKNRYEFEFAIVENGSVDSTFEKLLAIRRADRRFKILRLSRNFGIEGGVTAGLQHISGDAAVIMCADLQDPPEMIPSFIEKWEEGYQNVYAVVTRRAADEGAVRRGLTRVFYWLVDRLNQHPVPQNASDFRLVDRKLYEILNRLDEKNRMLRTIWGWLGFRAIGIPYERPPRHGGKSTFALGRNVAFALHGIASSSTTPLKIIPMFGVSVSILSLILLVAFIIRWILLGVPFSGFGTIVAVSLVLFSVLFLFLGIVSEYVGMIFEEVRNRPVYVLDDIYGDTASERTSDSRILTTVK